MFQLMRKLRNVLSIRSVSSEQSTHLKNIVAHQSYLETLQFEQNSVRLWSNMMQNQIMGETDQIHQQLSKMVSTTQQQQNNNLWTRTYTEQQMPQTQAAPPPRPGPKSTELQGSFLVLKGGAQNSHEPRGLVNSLVSGTPKIW